MTTTTKLSITPYGNRILVAIPLDVESDIIIPDSAQGGAVPYWEVLGVGDDVKRIKAGELVLLDAQVLASGAKVRHGDREALLCYEISVIAKVDADR